MAKTASKSPKKPAPKSKTTIAEKLAIELADPIPLIGDKVTLTASKVGSIYEVTHVSDDGCEVNLALPRTNLERFRVLVSDLTFVERSIERRPGPQGRP